MMTVVLKSVLLFAVKWCGNYEVYNKNGELFKSKTLKNQLLNAVIILRNIHTARTSRFLCIFIQDTNYKTTLTSSTHLNLKCV
jgi:hypothetical protein